MYKQVIYSDSIKQNEPEKSHLNVFHVQMGEVEGEMLFGVLITVLADRQREGDVKWRGHGTLRQIVVQRLNQSAFLISQIACLQQR